MDYPKHERLDIYLAAQLGLLQFEQNPNKQRKYIDFIDFYADLSSTLSDYMITLSRIVIPAGRAKRGLAGIQTPWMV